MEEKEKYYYYKIYVYKKAGAPASGIKHNVSPNLNVVKEVYEKEARKILGDNFHYLDIWTMDERFLEVDNYKKEKGLE